jgi:hypothetical protein
MNFEKEDEDIQKVPPMPVRILALRQNGYLSSQRASNERLDQVDVQRIAWVPLIHSALHAEKGHQNAVMSKHKRPSCTGQGIMPEKMMNAADEPDRSTALHQAHDATADTRYVVCFVSFGLT